MNITELTVHELQEKIKNKELTITEINEAYVNRLKEKESEVQAFITDLTEKGNIDRLITCTLEELYEYENELHIRHPQNNNIKPKIRQQLQFLRDKGFIEFLGNGKYRKRI